MLELVFDRVFGLDDALTFANAFQGIRQAVIGLRADNNIDGRRTTQDFLAFGLSNASSNANHELAALLFARLFHVAQTTKRGVDLFSRLLADMTGVEQNQISLAHVFRLDVTVLRQRIAHADGIINVHLTAVGLDEDFTAVRTLTGSDLGGV